jgi:site-specific recombinase XerD
MQIYNPVDYVFYSNDIAKSISTDCIQQYFKKLLSQCNISKTIHVHTLRHCFAAHLLENGTSIFYIMHLLGNSNIQTTMIYLHMRSLESLNIVSPIDKHHFDPMQTPAIVGHQMFLQSA